MKHVLVDFLDGDERDVCSKCDRRFDPCSYRPSSMCYECDPYDYIRGKDDDALGPHDDFDPDDDPDDDFDDDEDF